MVINKIKLLAASFIITGSVLLILNDLKFSPLAFILKVVGIGIFLYAMAKQKK